MPLDADVVGGAGRRAGSSWWRGGGRPGLRGSTVVLVGLPDAVVRQSVDRVRAAVVNSGHEFPLRRMTIGAVSSHIAQAGHEFDLALAVAVLAGAGVLPTARLSDSVLLGELGLDGRLRAVRGVLPAVVAAARAGHWGVVVPAANADEAAWCPAPRCSARALRPGLGLLPAGDGSRTTYRAPGAAGAAAGRTWGTWWVRRLGRRAVEVAAAGGHRLLPRRPARAPARPCWPNGCPACSRRWTTRRRWRSAPCLGRRAAGAGAGLATRPPYEAPHHTATMAALVGGGSGHRSGRARSVGRIAGCCSWTRRRSSHGGAGRAAAAHGARPGRRSPGRRVGPSRARAARARRQPLPVRRAAGETACTSSRAGAPALLSRLSGPLLDRVDLQVGCRRWRRPTWLGGLAPSEPTPWWPRAGCSARAAAADRLAGTGLALDSRRPGPALRDRWPAAGRLPGCCRAGAGTG